MEISNINWGSVADWVSGLGSFSAVVVALYLSNESKRIKLRGYAGLRVLIDGDNPSKELMTFSVANIGHRSTVINTVALQVGLFKKKHGIIMIVQDHISSKFPCPLADGEEACWNIPIGKDKSWLVDLCENFVRTPMDVRTLRFKLCTTNGQSLILKPEKYLKESLLKIINSKKAS